MSSNTRISRFGDSSSDMSIVFTTEGINELINANRMLGSNIALHQVSKLLDMEKRQNQLYSDAWNRAVDVLIKKGKISATTGSVNCVKIAICCYTIENPNFYTEFNKRCKELNANSWEDFPYKSMWILLKEAIFSPTIVGRPKTDTKYFCCYRGLNFQMARNHLPKIGDIVYTKQFMSTSVESIIAKNFAKTGNEGKGTLIEIIGKPEAAKGVSIYSEFDSEEEILFAPWEAFTVNNIQTNDILDKIVLQA